MMETTVRVTQAGGITIPAKVRREFGVEAGDHFVLRADENGFQLTELFPKCIFCGSTSKIQRFQKKFVCKGCLAQLRGEKKKSK